MLNLRYVFTGQLSFNFQPSLQQSGLNHVVEYGLQQVPTIPLSGRRTPVNFDKGHTKKGLNDVVQYTVNIGTNRNFCLQFFLFLQTAFSRIFPLYLVSPHKVRCVVTICIIDRVTPQADYPAPAPVGYAAKVTFTIYFRTDSYSPIKTQSIIDTYLLRLLFSRFSEIVYLSFLRACGLQILGNRGVIETVLIFCQLYQLSEFY